MRREGVRAELNKKDLKKVQNLMGQTRKVSDGAVTDLIGRTVIKVHRDTVSPASFPVVTGALRSSYMMEVEKYRGAVYSELEYAPYVEHGTHKMSPQPHLIPAWEKTKPDFLNRMKQITRSTADTNVTRIKTAAKI